MALILNNLLAPTASGCSSCGNGSRSCLADAGRAARMSLMAFAFAFAWAGNPVSSGSFAADPREAEAEQPAPSAAGDAQDARPFRTPATVDTPAHSDPVYSGPQRGEPLPGFRARIVWGDEAGQELDLVGRAEQRPWVLVFVHQITRPSIGVVRAIMRYAASRSEDGLQAAVVFLTADATETENFLRRARHALPQDVVIAISTDGLEGPGEYGLNRHAALTVLVARDGVVTASFALVQPSLQADVLPVVGSIVAMLGGGEVPPLQRLLAQDARMDRAGGAGASREVAGNQIRSLLQPLIRPNATDDEVRAMAATVERQLENNVELRRRIGEIASRIVQSNNLANYGTPAAQDVLRDWARKFGPRPADSETTDSTR